MSNTRANDGALLRATGQLTSPPRHESTAVPAVPVVDVYGAIHKGLRYCLCELLTRTALTAAHDAAATARIFDDLDGALYLLGRHGEHEERHLHAALEARRAGSSAPFAAIHELLERTTAELRACVCAYNSAPPGARAGAWRAFYLSLSGFTGLQLAHMSDEELRAQPLLDALYPEPELRAIHQGLLRSIGPEERVAALRVMLLGTTAPEREALLDGARAVLPEETVASLVAGMRTSAAPAQRPSPSVPGASADR